MAALHGGNRDNLEVSPNLWAGVGLVRGGAGTALVGDGPTVAARVKEYAALRDPLLRAQYLLALRGVDVSGDETSRLDDQTLLMEILETHEALEDAETEADIDALKIQNSARVEKSIAELERSFAANDIEAAAREAVRLRYWKNIEDGLKNWVAGERVVLQHKRMYKQGEGGHEGVSADLQAFFGVFLRACSERVLVGFGI